MPASTLTTCMPMFFSIAACKAIAMRRMDEMRVVDSRRMWGWQLEPKRLMRMRVINGFAKDVDMAA